MSDFSGVADSFTSGGDPSSGGLCSPWFTADEMRPIDDCASCKSVTAESPDDEILGSAILAASEYLNSQVMFQFPGICEATVRPCGNEEGFGWGNLWAWTAIPFYLPAGIWPFWGTGCGSCGSTGGCNCCGPEAFSLGYIPIVAISEVKLDGEVLTEGLDYVLIDNLLTKLNPDTGAGEAWPFACQDVASDDDLPGTLSVSFSWGSEPPQLGINAARDLACKMVQRLCGGDCGKPSERMTQKTAGGTTIQLLSPNGDISTVMPDSVKEFLKAFGPSIDGVRTPPKLRRPNSGTGWIFTPPVTDFGWQRSGFGSGCAGCG